MCWFSAFNRYNAALLNDNFTFKNFCFEDFKMAPVCFIILLELVLNTLVDASFLSAAYIYVFRQQI